MRGGPLGLFPAAAKKKPRTGTPRGLKERVPKGGCSLDGRYSNVQQRGCKGAQDGARVKLFSRPGNDLTDRFPLIVDALGRLRSRSCIIDGEAVACDDKGVASFDFIRHHRLDDKVFLYNFDLIELNGDDLRRDPLQVRKATLSSILAKAGLGIRFNLHIEGDAPTVFAHACKLGLEGIVSKQRNSPYRSRPLSRLAQNEEPGRASSAPRGRRGLGAIGVAGDPGFWDVAWNWPLPFVIAVATLAMPIVGAMWLIWHLIYKQQIALLKDRVGFAEDRLADAKGKIAKAEEEKTAVHTTVKELIAEIEKLKKRKAGLPRELQSVVDRLANTSATASNQVSKLTEAQEAVAVAVSKPPIVPDLRATRTTRRIFGRE